MRAEEKLKEASINITPEEFQSRRQRLGRHLQSLDLSGVVLFDNYYILYFSGFAFVPTERPIAFAMTAGGQAAMFVPRLELEHARSKTGFDRVDHYQEYPFNPHPMEVLADTLADMGIGGQIGADQDGYPWILGYRGPGLSEVTNATVSRINAFMEELMAVKSEAEIGLIKESAKWGNLAHRLLQTYTRPGMSEIEVSQAASDEATLTMLQTLGSLFQAQSAFSNGPGAGYRGQIGRNAAIPHALANNIHFQLGDVLVTGAGCPMWGYESELERTMIVGQPSGEQRRMFDHMKTAQETAIGMLKPGNTCSDVDRAVRDYYEANDLMQYWKHHSGHAIGLRYHEGPFLDLGDTTELRPGMVFTVEPGLYRSDLGGFRHSDTVLVTDSEPELLTYYPRDLDALIIPA